MGSEHRENAASSSAVVARSAVGRFGSSQQPKPLQRNRTNYFPPQFRRCREGRTDERTDGRTDARTTDKCHATPATAAARENPTRGGHESFSTFLAAPPLFRMSSPHRRTLRRHSLRTVVVSNSNDYQRALVQTSVDSLWNQSPRPRLCAERREDLNDEGLESIRQLMAFSSNSKT